MGPSGVRGEPKGCGGVRSRGRLSRYALAPVLSASCYALLESTCGPVGMRSPPEAGSLQVEPPLHSSWLPQRPQRSPRLTAGMQDVRYALCPSASARERLLALEPTRACSRLPHLLPIARSSVRQAVLSGDSLLAIDLIQARDEQVRWL